MYPQTQCGAEATIGLGIGTFEGITPHRLTRTKRHPSPRRNSLARAGEDARLVLGRDGRRSLDCDADDGLSAEDDETEGSFLLDSRSGLVGSGVLGLLPLGVGQ